MAAQFEGEDVVKLDGLEALVKAVKAKPVPARIGILGDKSSRKKGQITNATVGAAHEFGSLVTGLPKRSFLRQPLIDNLQKELDQAGAFSEAEQAEIIKQKSLVPWTKKMAILAENIVKMAFDTGGFGKWPQLKKETLARKTTGQILVETTQLRDSITSDVKS